MKLNDNVIQQIWDELKIMAPKGSKHVEYGEDFILFEKDKEVFEIRIKKARSKK